MRAIKLSFVATAATLLVACNSPVETESTPTTTEITIDNTARDRLEAQGIVYSTTDWETTVRKICETDKPGVYMGIESEIRKHRSDLTDSEKRDMILSSPKGGQAPNADVLTDREKQMVIDVVQDDACGNPKALRPTVEKKPGDLAERIENR